MAKSIRAAANAAAQQSVAGWQLEQRLRRLGYEGYGDYLGSSAWYRLKARYRKSELPQNCSLCGADEDIDLHHRTYERVCEEELTDLIPLCTSCHRLAHELVRRGDLPDFDTESLDTLVDPDRARENRKRQPPVFDRDRQHRVARAEEQVTQAEQVVSRLRSKGKRTSLAEQAMSRAKRRAADARTQPSTQSGRASD